MEVNEFALNVLIAYGFSIYISRKALSAVGGESIDLALDWIDEHYYDTDYNS
jgi:uncharacterized UBP type Zn finger protein